MKIHEIFHVYLGSQYLKAVIGISSPDVYTIAIFESILY